MGGIGYVDLRVTRGAIMVGFRKTTACFCLVYGVLSTGPLEAQAQVRGNVIGDGCRHFAFAGNKPLADIVEAMNVGVCIGVVSSVLEFYTIIRQCD